MGELHALAVEDVEDRVPAVREVLVAGVDQVLGRRREHRDVLPDRRAGEPDHHVDAEPAGGAGGHLHLLRGALAHALGVAVAPDPVGQDAAVALVDRVVAHRLALEVVADREHLQVVLLQHLQLRRDVGVVLDRGPRVEVVTPARELEAVVAPPRGQPAHLLERQVGPLAGEQGDRAWHACSSACGVVVSAVPVRPCGDEDGANRCRDGARCPGTGRGGDALRRRHPARTEGPATDRSQGRTCERTGATPCGATRPCLPSADVLSLDPAPRAASSACATGA